MSAQRDRLKNGYYNSREYNAATNPGGMARNGHRTNFPAACADIGFAVQEMVDYDDANRSSIANNNAATLAAVQASNDAAVATMNGIKGSTQTLRDQAAASATAASGSSGTAADSAGTAVAAAATATRVVVANFPDRIDATGSAFSEALTGDPGALVSPAAAKIVNAAGYGYVYQATGAATLAHKGVMTAAAEYVIEVAVEIEQTALGAGETAAARIRLQGLDKDYASTGANVTGPLVVTPVGVTTITRRFAFAAPSGGTAWPQPGVAVWLRPAIDINRKSDDSGAAAGSTARVRRMSVRDVTAVVAAELAAAAAANSAASVNFATQAQAEAGTSPAGVMSPLLTAQAIARQRAPGANVTGSTTLDNTSLYSQAVTTTAPGQSVVLPAANAYTVLGVKFAIYNAGNHDLLVKNASGVVKGFIRPRSTGLVVLTDLSSVAGGWSIGGAAPYGVTAKISTNSISASLASVRSPVQVYQLDTDRELVLLSTSAGLYGLVYNRTTQTAGAFTLIGSSGSASALAIVLSATSVLVAMSTNTNSQVAALVLSITGTTITVNAAATTTLSITFQSFSDFQVVGTTFVLIPSGNSGVSLLPMTVAGTTVTIGGEKIVISGGGNPGALNASFVSGSTLVGVAMDSGGAYIIRAFAATVSGASITINSTADVGISSGYAGQYDLRVEPFSANKWLVVHTAGTSVIGGCFLTLSGATVGLSGAGTSLFSGVATQHAFANGLASKQVASGKALLAWLDGASLAISLVLDGVVPNVTTPIRTPNNGATTADHVLAFGLNGTDVYLRVAAGSGVGTFVVSCATNTPVVTQQEWTDAPLATVAVSGRHSSPRGAITGALSGSLGVVSPAGFLPCATLQTPAGLRKMAADSEAPGTLQAISASGAEGWNVLAMSGAVSNGLYLRKLETAQ